MLCFYRTNCCVIICAQQYSYKLGDNFSHCSKVWFHGLPNKKSPEQKKDVEVCRANCLFVKKYFNSRHLSNLMGTQIRGYWNFRAKAMNVCFESSEFGFTLV